MCCIVIPTLGVPSNESLRNVLCSSVFRFSYLSSSVDHSITVHLPTRMVRVHNVYPLPTIMLDTSMPSLVN